jgi:hypothetical protein
MIKMGEITCRIPSNGIKPEILYCTEPEGYKLDQWTVSIELIVAAVTVLLFIVAYRTLRQMKDDSDRQWNSMQTQLAAQDRNTQETIAANSTLAREEQHALRLIEHLQAIRSTQMKTLDLEEDLLEAESKVSITWMAWSMFLGPDKKDFLKLTQGYSDDFSAVSRHIKTMLQANRLGELTDAQLKAAVDRWGDLGGNYIGNLSHWQMHPAQRDEKERNIRSNWDLMRASFPNVLFKEAPVG